jgi:hypothetical protein
LLEGATAVLSLRDQELLDALVHRVRVFSVRQVARTWWSHTAEPEANARKRLLQLQADGFLRLFPALARPEIPIQSPIATWNPGEDRPHFGEVSYRLKSRWTEPAAHVTCTVATARAGQHFGGSGGRLPREKEQTHDLHLSAVFLLLRNRTPDLVRFWISEAAILRNRDDRSENLPDAILNLDTGPRLIEFGGAYSKEKLEGFHDYCSQNALPYELW